MKKVSIVTVSYNCEDSIERTINSVISQDYFLMEYLIIDGASQDGTLDIIRRYMNSIKILVSEPDNGIFDAMNKSLNYVTGDYVLFMNAGDFFVNNHIVSDIFSTYDDDDDLIYGDDYVLNKLGYLYRKAKAIYEQPYTITDLIFKSQGFSHQSLFTKVEQLKKVRFSLQYPLGADYHTTYTIYRIGNHKIKYVDKPISVFDDRNGGVSHSGRFQIEIYQEREAMFGYKFSCKDKFKLLRRKITMNFKYFITKIFPKVVSLYRMRNRNYINKIS